MVSEMKLLEIAYARFESFKGLIVGFLVSSKDRESSRIYFLKDNALSAFRLIEYELSFMYQVLLENGTGLVFAVRQWRWRRLGETLLFFVS